MNIPTFSIHGDGSTRRMCVVNGQAFYQSSGTSSDLPGTWLPFNGVLDDHFSSFVGMIQKPHVSNNPRAKINNYFPPEVAEAIKFYMPRSKEWGRFQNMSSLIISCILSPEDAIPPNIKAAVLKYIEPNTLPTPIFEDSSEPPLELENYNVDKINSKLLAMGATATPEPIEPSPYLPYIFSLQETKYDPTQFDPTKFIHELQTNDVTNRFRSMLAVDRPESSISSDSTESGKTDRDTDTPSPFD